MITISSIRDIHVLCITKNEQLSPIVSNIFGVDLFVALLSHVLLQNIPGLKRLLAIDAGLENIQRKQLNKNKVIKVCCRFDDAVQQ